MIAYKCKNCNRLIVWGCINKYNEHFCNEKCYKKYCASNNYEANTDELRFIK